MMKHVSTADVVELARDFCRGEKSREEVSRAAQQIINDAGNHGLSVDDGAFDLLTYLVLIDECAPDRRYLYSDEEIRDELSKLGVA